MKIDKNELDAILTDIAKDKTLVESAMIVHELARKEIQKARMRKRIYTISASAAAILLVVLFGYQLFQQQDPSQQLFQDNYTRLDTIINKLPVDHKVSQNPDDSLQTTALKYYKEKQYSEAKRLLLSCIRGQRDNPSTRFYLAMTYLETAQKDSALFHLKNLSPYGKDEDFEPHQYWYIALIYISKREKSKAIPYLKQLSSYPNNYQLRASNLLVFCLKKQP